MDEPGRDAGDSGATTTVGRVAWGPPLPDIDGRPGEGREGGGDRE